MKHKLLMLALCLTATIGGNSALAGKYSFDSLKSLVSSDSEKKTVEEKPETAASDADVADENEETLTLEQQSEMMVYRYVESVKRLANAQVNFAEALGAKKEADTLRAATEALSSSHYKKDDIKKQAKISRKTNELIIEKMEVKQELTEEERKLFTKGLLHYAIGLKETKEFGDEVGPFLATMKEESKTVSKLSLASVSTAAVKLFDRKFTTLAYLTKKMPGYMGDHRKTAMAVTAFAKDNDIKLPEELDDASWI
jgi:hypothetical protein